MNIWLIFPREYNLLVNRINFSSLNLLILTICSYFLHLFNENQYIWFQICCSLLCIILNKCFVIKERNSDLVPLLSYHVKYLVISHSWQLLHMITFERGLSLMSCTHLPIFLLSNVLHDIHKFIDINSFGDFINHEKVFNLHH